LKRNRIFPVLALALVTSIAYAENADNAGPPNGLNLQFVFAKKQYHLGERIEVTLRYTYTGPLKLAAVLMSEDQPGRPTAIGISVAGVNGAKSFDPSRYFSGTSYGGYPHKAFDADGVCEDKIDLNEWVVFETPGTFRITGWSRAVGDAQTVYGIRNERYVLSADPGTIEILPAEEALQMEQIKAAESALKSENLKTRSLAARTLWYMKDERAIPLLVQCLGDTREKSNLHRAGFLGLLRFDDMEPIKNAVLKRMEDDPSFPYPYFTSDIAWLLSKTKAFEYGSTEGSRKQWQVKLKERYFAELNRRDPAKALNDLAQMMAQGHADRADAKLWRGIFEAFALLNHEGRGHIAFLLHNDFDLKEFTPQLRRLAADEMIDGNIRSAAIVALHRFKDESMREAVFEDLVKPVPKLSIAAHETLDDYKAKERSAALLKLVGANAPSDIGQRIGNFATAATAEELQDVYERLLEIDCKPAMGMRNLLHRGVLTGLAFASPSAALKIIDEMMRAKDQQYRFNFDEAFNILARLNLPEAKSLTTKLISTLDDRRLQYLIIALGSAARPNKRSVGDNRELQPNDAVAKAVFPNLLDWVKANPKSKVRDYARRTLKDISGIPKTEQLVSDAEAETVIPEWSKWWNEHKKE